MTKRIGSIRRKSRSLVTKAASLRGKHPIARFIRTFSMGQKVVLKVEPSYHKGMYFLRFHGLTGEVVGVRGRVYEVSVRDGGKQKVLLVNPVHLVGI